MRKTTPNIRDRQRDKDIFERRKRGETFVALGKRYGISADRIRQLYLREGFERSGTKKQ